MFRRVIAAMTAPSQMSSVPVRYPALSLAINAVQRNGWSAKAFECGELGQCPRAGTFLQLAHGSVE
jgi:hypothetical protein